MKSGCRPPSRRLTCARQTLTPFVIIQIGLRYRRMIDALSERMTRRTIIAVTAIDAFSTQVLWSITGDGVRAARAPWRSIGATP